MMDKKQLEEFNKVLVQGDFSKALEHLAQSVGLNPYMGPRDVLRAMLASAERLELLVYYSRLMSEALCAQTTLGKGMYREWSEHAVIETLGKRVTRRNTPNTAVYPYYLIYWQDGVAKEQLKLSGKESFNIAESGAMADKELVHDYFTALPIRMERFAYTFSRIGQADVNKLIDFAQELRFMDITPEMQYQLQLLLPQLEALKAMDGNIKAQRALLIKLSKDLCANGVWDKQG